MNKLPPGTFVVGNKLMSRCDECGNLVQINKAVFGDLHFCLTDEEIKNKNKNKIKKR